MAKDDLIPAEGVGMDKLPDGFFKARLDGSEHAVPARVSGKMRKLRVRAGGRVAAEMSPYDLSRGPSRVVGSPSPVATG